MSSQPCDDIIISRRLSWILRHSAIKEGLHITSDGFVKITEILLHPKLINDCSVTDLFRIVEQSSKQRFALKQDNNQEWWIRANQGHSIKFVELNLIPIRFASNIDSQFPTVIHGTYYKNWKFIREQGLHHMQRNHIHFAQGIPDDCMVISGMKSSSQLFIYINLNKALQADLKFYLSENGVILSPGDKNGFIRPNFFLKIVDAKTGWPNAIPKERIVECMSKYGEIASNYIAQDNSFMITKYKDPAVAQGLIQLGKIWFSGRKIFLSPKKRPKQPAPMPAPENVYEPILKIIKNQQSLGAEIDTLVSLLQPDLNVEVQKYMQLCVDLETGLQSMFPGAKVHPFGSTITGLAFRDSDVDAFIHVPHNLKKHFGSPFYVTAVSRAKECLAGSMYFSNLVAIPRAKTPIVRCVHRPTGIKCDFNFKNMLGVCNSNFIQFFARLDYKLKPCLLFIKFWAKIHTLSEGSSRFTNYALNMMFVFYVQQEFGFPAIASMQENPVCINMQDGWNGGFNPNYPIDMTPIRNSSYYELLKGFFNFFVSFNYASFIMCPYLGRPLDKTCFEHVENVPQEFELYRISYNEEHLRTASPICLQDPFEHNRNLTSSINSKFFEEYMEEFRRALQVFEDQQPHLLHNACAEQYKPLPVQEVYFKMPKQSDLSFLMEGITVDKQQERAFELKKRWFDMVNAFVIDVLTEVFKFELTVEDNKRDQIERSPKRMKASPGLLTSLYDSVTIRGTAKFNLWDARAVIRNAPEDTKVEATILKREIAISKYIQDILLKDLNPTKPIVNATVHIEYYIVDAHAVLKLESNAIENDEGSSNYFDAFTTCFSKSFPAWLGVHCREQNSLFCEKQTKQAEIAGKANKNA